MSVIGYHGRFLSVDLTHGRVTDEPVPEAWLTDSLGGRGWGARVALRDIPAEADPLGPDNVLAFTGGPLTGRLIAGAGRHAVHARSPLTGLLGESFSGGFFGTEMARTGYDGFVVRGASDTPVFLEVVDGEASLHDATALWGKRVGEVEATLLERVPKGRVASIGPAGERLVRFAAIMNDRNRAAGRTGMGAVMGSKRLKAVVVRGKDEAPVADKAAFNAARKAYVRTIADAKDGFGVLGTTGGVAWYAKLGILPTKNWRAGTYADATAIDGRTMHDSILVKRDTCTACPVMCKRVVETVFNGVAVAPAQGGPEYETLAAFGSLQEIADLDYVAAANALCNELGLDTISAGSVIAHAMEAHERGLLDGASDVPAWGDAAGAFALLEKVGLREGTGDALAEGVARFAARHASEAFAVHVKGCEVPMHEPRGKKGLGVSYATTFRGANHMDGVHDTALERADAWPEHGVTARLSRFSVEDKARLNKVYEDGRSFVNSLVMCAFDVDHVGPERNLGTVIDLVNAVTGRALTEADAFEIGERNYQLGRLASVKFGLTPRLDDLPDRLKALRLAFKERDGTVREEAVEPDEFAVMKREYYDARGWTPDGVPDAATRARLRLP